MNTIQYLSDLRDLTRLLPKIGKLDNPKTYASLYLWYKYSLMPNKDDTSMLLDAIRKTSVKIRREKDKSISTYASMTCAATNRLCSSTWEKHYKLTSGTADNRIDRVLQSLDEWGLLLTPSVAYDFIPYSFVVDWFLDLGSLFEDVGNDWRLQKYPIFAVCKSTKRIDTFNCVDMLGIPGLLGTISYKSYTRNTGTQADTFVPRIDSPRPFRHYLEGAALIVSSHK